MAAPIGPKNLAGDVPSPSQIALDPPAVPPDPRVLQQQIQQLQNSLNALIVVFNAHVHTENTAVSYTQNASSGVSTTTVDGTSKTAANLFTAS